MTDTLVASLVSAAGVVISVSISVLIVHLQNRAALDKVKRELEQQYAKSLFEQRIKVYPELYNLLSAYRKVIAYGTRNTTNLIEFRKSVDEWNSKYSIFFSEATSKISHRFRFYLRLLLQNGETSIVKDEDWEAIRKIIGYFEESLKTDIGILDMPPVGKMKDLEKVYLYIDQQRASKQLTDSANEVAERQIAIEG